MELSLCCTDWLGPSLSSAHRETERERTREIERYSHSSPTHIYSHMELLIFPRKTARKKRKSCHFWRAFDVKYFTAPTILSSRLSWEYWQEEESGSLQVFFISFLLTFCVFFSAPAVSFSLIPGKQNWEKEVERERKRKKTRENTRIRIASSSGRHFRECVRMCLGRVVANKSLLHRKRYENITLSARPSN